MGQTDGRIAVSLNAPPPYGGGGSIAEWLACWTQAQKDLEFKSQPRSCRVSAKFHYTDPTGPGSPTKSAHVVGYSSYPTTCADFVGDPLPVGSV